MPQGRGKAESGHHQNDERGNEITWLVGRLEQERRGAKKGTNRRHRKDEGDARFGCGGIEHRRVPADVEAALAKTPIYAITADAMEGDLPR